MRRPSVTDTQLLMLFELCLDAEDRCDARRREAGVRGDNDTATREAQLEERYKNLRNRLFLAMKEDPAASALEQLAQEVLGTSKALKEKLSAGNRKPPLAGA